MVRSVQIDEDELFNGARRSKSKTIAGKGRGVKTTLSHYSAADQQSAKEAVRKTLYEIEDNFKLLKHLHNQRLHPFDLSQDELCEIKQYFPEFFPKNLAAKRQV